MAQLPDLVDRLCCQWELERDQDALWHGYNAAVVPVRRSSEQLVLKLTWPASGIGEEMHGLEAWDGHGMVRMLAGDATLGALLLERLDPARTLAGVEAMDAARIAGRLLRRLAVPAPSGFRNVHTLVAGVATTLAAQMARPDCPVPREWLEAALAQSRYLAVHARTHRLIHADFHYDNILAGRREPWLAIDPRPVAGEPEQAVPELLWTRHDVADAEGIRRLFGMLVESAGLNAERTRSWAIVRCVDYWLWGVEHGLTEDPKRCRLIVETLL